MGEFDVFVTQEQFAEFEEREHFRHRGMTRRVCQYEQQSRFHNGMIMMLWFVYLITTLILCWKFSKYEERFDKLENPPVIEQEEITVKMPLYCGTDTELLTCPICGWAAQYQPCECGWYIECTCPECGVKTHEYIDKDAVLKAWNNEEVYSDVL